MRLLNRSAILALAVAGAGCEFIHPPTAIHLDDEPVVVHAVLAVGSDRVAVLVTRVVPEEWVPGEVYHYDPGMEPVSGAEVSLVQGTDTVRLEEAPADLPDCYGGYGSPTGEPGAQPTRPGCYGARLPAAVRSGELYRLHIRLPGGEVVEGEATPPPVPASAELDPEGPVSIDPAPDDFDAPGQVRVRVQTTAAGIGLALRPGAAFVGDRRATDVQCGIGAPPHVVARPGADGTLSLPIHGVGCYRMEGSSYVSVRPDSLHAALYVTAYDEAFVRYQEAVMAEQAGLDAAAQGLSGALGLFAGEATLERTITLVFGD